MKDTDAFQSRLQATVASLRYWVPAISDAARVEESDADGVWQLSVRPLFEAACPFALSLSTAGTYAITVDRVSYGDLPIESFDIFLPLAEAISEGRVVHRHWTTANTGTETEVETIIDLGHGKVWSALRRLPAAAAVTDPDNAIRRDRHFLPYRRR